MKDMKDQNKAYKKRGMEWLIAFFVAVALCAVIFGFFWNQWYAALGATIGGGLYCLTNFIKLRRMTPEQFAAYRKKERMDYDERAAMISGKSCAAALSAVLIAACAEYGFFAVFYENAVARRAVFSLLILGCAVLLVAHKIYSERL